MWVHFKEGRNEAQCNYCSQKLSTKSGSLGNLKRHMSNKHPTISLCIQRQLLTQTETPHDSDTAVANETISDVPTYSLTRANEPPRPVPSSSQPAITNFIRKPPPTRRVEQIDQQVVAMVTKGHHSLRIVEEPQFRKLIEMVSTCPGYQLPTRKTLSTTLIPKTYTQVFEKSLKKIKEGYAVCLCTDAWTSTANQSYIAVTAHFIDKNTEIQSVLLGCINFDERHTSANLLAFLKQIIQDWQLSNKVTCIVSDNAFNIVAAIRQGEWRTVSCFAHSLNLVVQDGIKSISDIVNKIKRIVEFFKKSSTAQSKLEDMQKQMGLPVLKLKQECSTRWNSCFDMMERILKTKDAVISTLALIKSDLSLQSKEWDIIEIIVPILQPFKEITTEISSEKHVSLSKVLIFVQLMAKHVVKCTSQVYRYPEISGLLERLQTQINSRFHDLESNALYADTTLLDPRFRQKGFRTPEAYQKAIDSLRRRVAEVRLRRDEVTIDPNPQIRDQEDREHSKATSSIWGDFDKEMQKITRPENTVAAGIRELDKYLNEEYLHRKEDPLKWWHSRKHIYPHLYELMLKRLCIQATSVSCERVFSGAGQVVTDRRKLLKPAKVSQMIFLHDNL